ncbi:MAG: dephospho-CoA kinase [Lachnospiraceae bacterium]|nr:dephospho-CoA kinase [Lachnospiraceae bacterium]
MPDKLLIVDGYSILNRAYYGVPFLSSQDGFPTNGIYGFYGILLRILEDQKPTHAAVAFDVHEPTFRHLRYAEYKGTRKPMPDDLKRQVPVLKELLQDSGIPILTLPGYEADDIMGTVGLAAEKVGMEVLLLSGDRDLFQLVSDSCCLCIPRTKNKVTVTEYYHEAEFVAEYGVTPEEFIAVKALMGDSSDNIPGVPHIGEKTALGLISRFHTLDELYRHLDEAGTPRIRTLLKENEEQARLSYELAKIDRHAPLDFSLDEARFETLYTAKAYGDFSRLQIYSLLKRFPDSVKNEWRESQKKQTEEAAESASASSDTKFPGKMVIGVTGGVGSGKSTVLSMLREDYGALILQADTIAAEMIRPGGASYEKVISLLGKAVLRDDGTIDRARMSDLVFADPGLLDKVNAIIHPDTLAEVRRRIEEAKESLIVYESAIPEEACFDELTDAVLYVYASEDTRFERLFFGRGYSFDKTESIMRRQLSEMQFRKMSDAEVNNNGSEEEARASLAEAMKTIQGKNLRR